MGESKSEHGLAPEFPAPQVDCMSATLSGTVPSCTPIADYDRVKVVLHRVLGGESNICSNHTAVHNADAANVFISALIRKNLTHGGFQINVSNLTPDANYCVTVELYRHPYCHLPLIVGNEVYRQPAVCRTHNVETPLKTTKECASPASVMGFRGSLNYRGMSTVIVCVVCVVICILTLTVACCRLMIRRRDKSKSGGITSNLYIATPNAKNGDVEVENNTNSCPGFDVFLIYLSDSPESDASNATLREWLGSLDIVKEVLDLSDPDRQEEILSRQEEWVTTVMANPNLRVVTVVSDKLKTLRNRGCWRPRDHHCGAASSSTSLSGTDACTSPRAGAGASSSATKPAAKAASDEERIRLLQYCEEERGEQVHKATCTETDALAELRNFALGQAVAHLKGQYGRLMLVRHETGTDMGKGVNFGDGGGNCRDVEDLTPLRRPLMLPQQVDELVRWLMPHEDPIQNYDRFKKTYENMLSRVCVLPRI